MKGVRHWWVLKPKAHNVPSAVVFEEFAPTILPPNHEWIKVWSSDDLEKQLGAGVPPLVEALASIRRLRSELELEMQFRIRDNKISSEEIAALLVEVKEFRELWESATRFVFPGMFDTSDAIMRHIQKLEKFNKALAEENEKLFAALKFYAKPDSWKIQQPDPITGLSGMSSKPLVEHDAGKLARAATDYEEVEACDAPDSKSP